MSRGYCPELTVCEMPEQPKLPHDAACTELALTSDDEHGDGAGGRIMANYREHISVSAIVGLGYGAGASVFGEFSPVQGALAGWLAAVGGLLPDLDLPTSRPVKELFGLVAVLAPLLLVAPIFRLFGWSVDAETILLALIVMYLAVRFGAPEMIRAFSKHRGMFHSFPAVLIAAEVVYLGYPNPKISVRLLMAGGVALGFLSHLALDELYSLEWKEGSLRAKSSSGTAFKMVGTRFVPNVVTYAIVMLLSYAVLLEWGLIESDTLDPREVRMAAEPVEIR